MASGKGAPNTAIDEVKTTRGRPLVKYAASRVCSPWRCASASAASHAGAGAALAAVNAVAGLTLLAVAAWLTLGMVGSALQDGAQSGDRG